jgi:iron complex transport system substrate-binding protein
MTMVTTRRRAQGLALMLAVLLSATSLVAQAPQRVISLVPNLTEMLFAMGAGPQVVAVSSFDREPEAVRTLPRVGALLDPDVERILSLRPDLVITYGSQVELKAQLARTGIAAVD